MTRKKLFSLLLIVTMISVSIIGFSSSAFSQVTIAIEDASGLPGSTVNPVDVSLANPDDKVKGISLDICDFGNFLTASGCEPAARAPLGFECLFNNLENGCVRAIIVNLDNLDMIGEGAGPVFTLEYDVSGLAPSGECRFLNPEDASVVGLDALGYPVELAVSLVPGEFCFFGCTSHAECDDGLFCNGVERCIDGVCQRGDYPCLISPDLSCDEETDQCVPGPGLAVITVEEGFGLPGSTGNSVPLSLTNPGNLVNGLSTDVCDVDNFLTASGCNPTGRTPYGFECLFNNLTNGCVRIILVNLAGSSTIEEGSGVIATIDYDVSIQAPSGGCRDLNPEEASVIGLDEWGDLIELDVALESGRFCFLSCINDADCDDGLFCNGAEQCDSGACQPGSNPCPPGAPCNEEDDVCNCFIDEDCDDGLFCTGQENCVSDICQSGINPCLSPLVCDENSDTCVVCLTDADCDDGLFCNGDEQCDSGSCQPGSDPCPPGAPCNEEDDVCNCMLDADCDDGFFCNGQETCVSNICQSGINPCPGQGCDEDENICKTVTIDVGDGLGFRGSTDNPLDVSLEYITTDVRGVQLDVCDADNFLTASGCEPAGRTPSGFECLHNNLTNGCVRVILFNMDNINMIEAGTGPIFTIFYDISETAPVACRDLNSENVIVVDKFNVPLETATVGGLFCFENCTANQDCDDGEFCNGAEQCVSGACQPGSDPCPDDGLFCTGVEGCDEENDLCTQSGDPCAPDLMCYEEEDLCYRVTIDIEDGSGFRGSKNNPVEIILDNPDDKVSTVQLDVCNVDYLTCTGCEPTGRSADFSCIADSFNGCCRVALTSLNGDSITEGIGPILTINYDISETAPEICRDLNPKNVSVLDEFDSSLETKSVKGEFCSENCNVNQDCNDGEFCNGEEQCVSGACQPGSDPCPDDGLFCTGVEGCDEENDLCTQSGNPCPPPYICDEENDICTAQITIIAEPAWATPGDVGVKVDICLDNQDYEAGGMQLDVCEEIDGVPVDCLTCVGCEMTERTVLFDCFTYELIDGCCRIIIMSKHPGGVINPAICSIVKIDYTLCGRDDPECPEECNAMDCITLTPENVVVADPFGNPLSTEEIPGALCPFECGDVYPPESAPGARDCGDGNVDIIDVLTEVNFALGSVVPDDCQILRANVPTGTPGFGDPPYCTPPDERVDVSDVMVLIDMALDRQDCCTYYYTGGIY